MPSDHEKLSEAWHLSSLCARTPPPRCPPTLRNTPAAVRLLPQVQVCPHLQLLEPARGPRQWRGDRITRTYHVDFYQFLPSEEIPLPLSQNPPTHRPLRIQDAQNGIQIVGPFLLRLDGLDRFKKNTLKRRMACKLSCCIFKNKCRVEESKREVVRPQRT